MKTIFNKFAGAFAFYFYATVSQGAIITSGDLVYDDQTNLITGGGKTYLGWDIGASWDYATTVVMTSAGGAYENFHIASQTEAYEFFNLAHTGSPVHDVAGHQAFVGNTTSSMQERFGDNMSTWRSAAFFLSDERLGYGYLASYGSNTIHIEDYFSTIPQTDWHADGGVYSHEPITWLLVSDSVTSVSEPGSLALVSLGILGLGIARKKAKY